MFTCMPHGALLVRKALLLDVVEDGMATVGGAVVHGRVIRGVEGVLVLCVHFARRRLKLRFLVSCSRQRTSFTLCLCWWLRLL